MYFQQTSKNWTSGNDDIDKFIQVTQLSAHDNLSKVLEWIPYDRFYDIEFEYVAKGGFGKMCRAKWIDGRIKRRSIWDYENQDWKREDQNMFVILKSLNNPKNFTLEFFMDEVYLIVYSMKIFQNLFY